MMAASNSHQWNSTLRYLVSSRRSEENRVSFFVGHMKLNIICIGGIGGIMWHIKLGTLTTPSPSCLHVSLVALTVMTDDDSCPVCSSGLLGERWKRETSWFRAFAHIWVQPLHVLTRPGYRLPSCRWKHIISYRHKENTVNVAGLWQASLSANGWSFVTTL